MRRQVYFTFAAIGFGLLAAGLGGCTWHEPVPDWIEQGPGPIFSGQVEGIQNRPVAGAVQSIAPHPTNSDILYIGTVSGGIWKTENAKSSPPIWRPLSDNMPSPAIGSVIFDPCDHDHQSLFAGTGNFTSGSLGGPALGIYHTADGGETWRVVGDQDTDGDTDIGTGSDFRSANIRNLVAGACNTASGKPVLLAGTDSGVFRGVFSPAGPGDGWTFSQLSGSPSATVPTGNITSLIADGELDETFYAASPGNPMRLFRSVAGSGGQNWTQLTAPISGNFIQVRLATSPALSESGQPPLYVAVAKGVEDAVVWRSTDRGATWNHMGSPSIGGRGPFVGRQWKNHFSLAADSEDPNLVYLGGDRQPQLLSASGTNDYSGNLFVGDWRSTRKTWVPLVGNFANGTSPHADSRHITFDASGVLLEADDGGVFRMPVPRMPQQRRWESINGNLRITEFYSVAWDSVNNVIFGGAQDVGSVEQMATGGPGYIPQWRDARLFSFFGQDFVTAEGDGGNVAVDNLNGHTSVRYIMMNNYFQFFRRDYSNPNPSVIPAWLTFSGPSCGPVPLPFCALAQGDRPSSAFYDPQALIDFAVNLGFTRASIAVNRVTPGRIAVGLNSVYLSPDQGATWQVAPLGSLGGRVTALSYGGTAGSNIDLLLAAIGNNLTIRTSADGPVITRNFSTGTISDIALDPVEWRRAYFVKNDQVLRIDDITQPESPIIDITGDLDSILSGFMTLEIVIKDGVMNLLVGGRPVSNSPTGRGGVARLRFADRVATGGFVARWTPFGRRLPSVTVRDLHYDEADDVLLAGTWGRGAWTVQDVRSFLRMGD